MPKRLKTTVGGAASLSPITKGCPPPAQSTALVPIAAPRIVRLLVISGSGITGE